MAEAYTKVYINTCGPNRYEDFLNIVKNAKSDGLVMHLNRSCKQMGLLNQEGAEYVNAKLGVPFVSFDGDQTDPNVFSQAQYETRVQALCEMIEENKK
jgi:benzoyl-CoA reductase/2-hydroxyglutaryl-CoA dehydratase subunit BcrC/BadD/HgdB